MVAFLLWTRQNSHARARARASELCIVHNRKVDACVGLLKEPQKIRIHFLELHGGFSIVDNTELRRARARASELCIVHNRKVDASVCLLQKNTEI